MVKAETRVQPGGAEMAVVNNLKRWLLIRSRPTPAWRRPAQSTKTAATFLNGQMRDRTHTWDLDRCVNLWC